MLLLAVTAAFVYMSEPGLLLAEWWFALLPCLYLSQGGRYVAMTQHREQQQTQKLLQELICPRQMQEQQQMSPTRSITVVATALPSSSSSRAGGKAQTVGAGILLTLSPISSALRWG
jgi:hypothetical protein